MTRQRRYQITHKAAGGCITCGKPRAKASKNYCQHHRLVAAASDRERKRRKAKGDTACAPA